MHEAQISQIDPLFNPAEAAEWVAPVAKIEPINFSLQIGDEVFEPAPVLSAVAAKNPLGLIGISEVVASADDLISDQRRDFFYQIADRITDSTYEMTAVLEAPVRLTAEDYAFFGYKPERFTQSAYDQDFHKENDPSLDSLKHEGRDWYRIVEDDAQGSWFLKTADKVANKYPGLHEVGELSKHLREVYASRIANEIEYPMLETKPVFYDGKPWLASKFVKDHEYHMTDVSQADRLSNPSALRTRYLFNALIGSGGDNSYGGIIDPSDNTYYAEDVSVFAHRGELEKTPEQIADDFLYDIKGTKKDGVEYHYPAGYGSDTPLGPEDKAYALNFLQNALAIDPQKADEMFPCGRGTFKNTALSLQHIKNRATALVHLIESGQLAA